MTAIIRRDESGSLRGPRGGARARRGSRARHHRVGARARRPSASAPRCSSSPTAARSARSAAAATRTTPSGRRGRRCSTRKPPHGPLRAERRLRAGERARLRRTDGGLHRAGRAAPRLYIFGAGHVGYISARLRARRRLPRARGRRPREVRQPERFPEADEVVVEDIPTWLHRAELPANAYAVIVTRGHRHDLDALRALARARPALPRPHRQQGQGDADLRRAARRRACRPSASRASTRRSASTSAPSRPRKSRSASWPS